MTPFRVESASRIEGIEIRRDAEVILMSFTDYFQGFEHVKVVRELFGDDTEQILSALRVEFNSMQGYMRVSSEDGHLLVSVDYLRHGEVRDIYLDIIHELVHVKQFREGIELRDRRFTYLDRPTEIEAFSYAVKEARRIGMTDQEIYEHLKTERMSDEAVKKLAKTLNVKPSHF